MKKLSLAAVLLTAVALSACSSYDDRGDRHARKGAMMDAKTEYFFDKMDLNHDGVVTRGESDGFGRRMFAQTDLNGDKVLTLEEVKEAKRREWEEYRNDRGMTNNRY